MERTTSSSSSASYATAFSRLGSGAPLIPNSVVDKPDENATSTMKIVRTSSTGSAASFTTSETFSRAGSTAPLMPDTAVIIESDIIVESKSSKDDSAFAVFPTKVPSDTSLSTEKTDDSSKSCSKGRATFNLIMTAIGTGITFLPKAVANSGWVGGVGLLLITCAYTNFCIRRLFQVLMNNASGRQVASFEELGEVTFGRQGKQLFRSLVCGVLFGMSMYMVDLQASAGFYLTNQSLSKQTWRWIANTPMIILAWMPSLKEVSLVSMAGVGATIGLMALISASSAAFMQSAMWTEGMVIVDETGSAPSEAALQYSLAPRALLPFGSAICQAMMAFSATPTAPTVVHSMRTPHEFPRVISTSFSVIVIVYLVVACVSYAAFGDHVSDNVIASIALASERLAPLKPLNKALQVVVILLCESNFLMLLAPLAADCERLLLFLFPWILPAPSECLDARRSSSAYVVFRSAARSAIVVAAIACTVAVQSGADRITAFVTLAGGLCVMPITVLIPIGCYWRTLQQTHQPHPNRLVLLCEVLLVLLCLGGVGLMVLDFINKVFALGP